MKRKMERKNRKINSSSLDSHKKQGKTLIPPFLNIPKLQPVSWMDERLPEFLWAALLIQGLGRTNAILRMKEVVKFWYDQPKEMRPKSLSHTDISSLEATNQRGFLNFLCKNEATRQSLQPLLLLCPELPGSEVWAEVLKAENSKPEMWNVLKKTIFEVIDHQSQIATDCRWLRVFYFTVINGLKHSRSNVEALFGYPNVGEMTSVRPYIRSVEMTLDFGQTIDFTWSKNFWRLCMERTSCIPLDISCHDNEVNTKLSPQDTQDILEKLKLHWDNIVKDTDINPKQDAVFGITFYCVSILEELLQSNNNVGILGRSGLRTLVECYITLAYLIKKDQEDLWKAYRHYGTGQAKLSLLKLTEKVDQQPSSINIDDLERLSNEDYWQEFLPMDLGNWAKANLRIMSEEAGIKDTYDTFYDWSSGFVHGHWGAVRDSVFVTCANPLHRFHRIPDNRRNLNNVISDAVILVNKILELLDKAYPQFSERIVASDIQI